MKKKVVVLEIKEMPKNCEWCPLNTSCHWARAFYSYEERPGICPLKEIEIEEDEWGDYLMNLVIVESPTKDLC